MKTGFTSIHLREYVELHLRANPNVQRTELIQHLKSTIAARGAGVCCPCGAPIWIIGSAQFGLGCFACITRQTEPEQDYEINVADEYATH